MSSSLHLLSGHVLPGLLDDWCGPVQVFHPETGEWVFDVVHPEGRNPGEFRLDLHRREALHRVVDVLGKGVRCEHDTDGDGDCHLTRINGCRPCNYTGYKIQPVNLRWCRDLPTWQGSAIVAASALRVAEGKSPIREILSPWRSLSRNHPCRRGTRSGDIIIDVHPTAGWRMSQYGSDHPGVVGEPGKDKADLTALAAGYSLLNEDHLLVPCLEDVIKIWDPGS